MYFQIQNGCKIVTILTPLPLQVWNLLGHTTYMASPMTRLVKPALNHVQKLLLRWVPPPQLRWQATTAIPQRKMAIYLTYGLLVVNHAHSTKPETPITHNQKQQTQTQNRIIAFCLFSHCQYPAPSSAKNQPTILMRVPN